MSKSQESLTDGDACCPPGALLREPLTAADAADMAVKLKALADPVRLQLFSAIASHAGGEACVCDISADIEVSQPTISHHLKVLRDAGLLTSQRRASWVYYAVVPDALRLREGFELSRFVERITGATPQPTPDTDAETASITKSDDVRDALKVWMHGRARRERGARTRTLAAVSTGDTGPLDALERRARSQHLGDD